MAPTLRCSLSILAVLVFAACTSGGGNDPVPAATDKLSATAALGEKISDDTSLSASGQVACATCHESDRAFAGDTVVPIGGVGVDVQGFRNAPSLKDLTQNPAFFFDDEGTPTAPYFHNGRFATLTEVLRFYVRRDTNPDEWYPIDPATGLVHKFDDQDVVGFLQTLTDGFTP